VIKTHNKKISFHTNHIFPIEEHSPLALPLDPPLFNDLQYIAIPESRKFFLFPIET